MREQIDSILTQDYPSVRILARDDGSTDRTVAILEEYVTRLPGQFTLLPRSTATGSAKLNFKALMQASRSDYTCCADQDDVWLPQKISRSMTAMATLEKQYGTKVPLLVFSDLQVVDHALRPLHASFWTHQGIDPAGINFLRRLLTQNVVTGCTTLLNGSLRRLAATVPQDAYMHDWWVALVVCAFGRAIFLPAPSVRYRQHDGNVLGAIRHGRHNLLPRLRFHDLRRAQWDTSQRQAEAMLRVFAKELSTDSRRLLEAYLRCGTSPNRLIRVSTLLRHRFFLNGLRPNLAMLWYLWDLEAALRSAP